jgi:hypothetical protein
MKTYTDTDVRKALERIALVHGYRGAGALLGVDPANLCRMAHGDRELTPQIAAKVGFEPIERAWKRKPA